MSNKSPKLQQLQMEVRAAQMGGDNLRGGYCSSSKMEDYQFLFKFK